MVRFGFSLSLVAALAPNLALATPYFRGAMPPFANATAVFDVDAVCVPFEDPHCCVDRAVCECQNGTFYSLNPRHFNGTYQLCAPPGNVTYGEDTSSIPGWCC
ncbi:hypothetical protein AAE478_006918 [Parahypoxylon ruwenzoriense]